ncbi:hypothetical protein [Agrobacterium tumefaciens]|uniref:hypothetical protein n=1 Tax=Agrobacterium tumefaciens TaxID=358 RepID=UPI000EF1A415|nr:hypothetical protein [Agrobacterium tumefaciens]AYM06239.1 hypothetical protein At1D1460_19970 [Agrobacterium tumefaciens]NSZ36041.1 hypothetical protein [Agrobacterium tumefaciens]QLG22649.1 hypothetical protein EML4_10070 [Agrobacterium tumefaciens]UXS86532.1 hypothetical protein FY144_10030 [Agrobacterium tumefaciens]
MTAPYTAGTIDLVSGSPTVVGTDTAWEVSLIIGGTIYVQFDGGNPLPIAAVNGDTEITAALNWTGPTGTYSYAIVRDTAYGQQTVTNAQALATYIQRLNNPALAAAAGVTPSADTLLLFTGPNTATVIDLEDLAGDVVGPSSAVNNAIATFNGTTGKLIKASTPAEAGVPIAGYISPGFNLTNSFSDPSNSLAFPVGVVASDNASPILMNHAPATLRSLNNVYGSGNGGRFDAAISDGWWHCFVISNGTVVGSGYSKSLDPTTQPNYPTGFTHYRRVASWLRRSGAFYPILQNEDDFVFVTAILERQSQAQQTDTLLTINCPLGIVTKPKLNSYQSQNAAGNVQTQISTPGTDLIPFVYTSIAGERDGTFINGEIMTDTSSRIRYASMLYSGTLTNNSLSLYGWIDSRGRA